MKKQEMLHWDRRRNAYIDPGYGVEVCVHRVNWIVVAVQIIGGVKRLEYESGYVREDIVQWMVQGYVNEPREARMLARNSGLPQYLFPVGCESNDM